MYAVMLMHAIGRGSSSQIILIANILITFSFPISLSLSLFLCISVSFFLLLCFLFLASPSRMLTAWLGICWPLGSLNQSRAGLSESVHTCPDRNDNDHDQSPPICPVSTVMSPFWNAHVVRGETCCILMALSNEKKIDPTLCRSYNQVTGSILRLWRALIMYVTLSFFIFYLSK